MTKDVDVTENVEVTERIPRTVMETVDRVVPQIKTKEVTETVPVREVKSVTETVRQVENVPITHDIQQTRMVEVAETVPVTNYTYVTEKVPVTRNVTITENIPTTKIVPDIMPPVNLPFLTTESSPQTQNVYRGLPDCTRCTGSGILNSGKSCERCVKATGNCAVCKNTGLILSDTNLKCNCLHGKHRL
jgi:hypothetical protein